MFTFLTAVSFLFSRPGVLFLQGGDHMGDWEDWFAMSIMMVLFWGGLVACAVLLVRFTSGHTHTSPRASALDIARERLAKGEISGDEFQQIRSTLGR